MITSGLSNLGLGDNDRFGIGVAYIDVELHAFYVWIIAFFA